MIQALDQPGPRPGGGDGPAAAFLDRAREKLRETFGFASFREGQERALAAIAGGRDVLVIMPTGGGKSLCYQIPALISPGVVLVISPLIALMKDQVDRLGQRGIPAGFINSSLTVEEQRERLGRLAEGSYRIVYVAPERFRSRAFRSALSQARVSLLAVDEAHCISHWGHDFRPDYRRLLEVRELVGGVPVVALTATATPEVQEDIIRELSMRDAERVVTGFHRPNLSLRARRVRGAAERWDLLREFVRGVLAGAGAGRAVPAGIVYAGTRKRAEEVADLLSAAAGRAGGGAGAAGGTLARAYHAGLTPEERRAVQDDFMEGRLSWVVATNAFGMGVDKPDIRFVVHCDLPGSIEAYYQEVGRGGRDGRPADCLLLHAPSDRRLREFFIEGSNPSRETIEAVYRFLHGLGENPIFRSVADLESLFLASGAAASGNPLVFRAALGILDRAGALERLEHSQNLAEVAPLAPLPWPPDPHPPRATLKRLLHPALALVFEQNGGEPAKLSLERWAEELGTAEDSLRRGLAQLAEEGWLRYLPPFRGRAIRLPPSPIPLDQAGIDFRLLNARRERDLERLERMVRFARSRSCRRDAILRYFGEPVPGGRCGRCDACLAGRGGSHPPRELSESELLLVRKALSGVARVQGRCGRGRVIQMLRGSASAKITGMGLDRLSTHGILRAESREDLERLFQELEESGCVRQSEDRFPVLRLTERGLRVMKGEERLVLALPGGVHMRGK